jgi:phosphoenolpyruvate-protein kinase (PTS system EI component)
MTNPSSGDVFSLSKVSRKIGQAFTTGQKSAPVEFQEIEAEINRLAKALKQLAEALHAEAGRSLIQHAAKHVQHDINTILDACKQTINDLDSLVDRNQVTKKHRTVGGFAIERSWSDSVLTDYATMVWTTGGGDLHSLRDLLRIHTYSATLLTQALQRSVIVVF